MECIKCKKLIADNYTFCPYCGKKQVKATYDLIDWEIYSKDRILFYG